MSDLILTIICTTSIGVIIKLSETSIRERLTMLLFNYIVATLISIFLLLQSHSTVALTSTSIILSPVGGFIFAFNFFLLIIAVKKRGVALPVSLMRLSAIVPVGVSLIFFGESPRLMQSLGMIGALIAAVIISASFKGGDQAKKENDDSKFLLAVYTLALLFCFGLADLTMKLFERLGQPGEKPMFLAILFGCAGVTVLIAMIAGRTRFQLKDAIWGIVLGVPNYFTSWFTVSALTKLPAYVVFPTITAATVMLIAFIGVVFFRERIGKMGLIGIALTMVSIWAVSR
jgi:drug/metabolite transporter (DMT)-like permease